jgi:hypothetical protein
MSQNDMDIADAPGATVRADLNSALQALASTSKGGSQPATPYAGQLWIDDSTPSSTVWTLYCYDGADDIKLGEIDSTNNRFAATNSHAADVASASTIDLDAATGDLADVTGTTTITAVTLAEGLTRTVRFTGALTLTHGASLVLPGAANITTAAGDFAVLRGYAAGVVRCSGYLRANGTPVGGGSYKVGSFTRDVSTATGSQAVTGVGFKPKAVLFFAVVGASAVSSWGFSDGSTGKNAYSNDNGTGGQFNVSSNAVLISVSSGNSYNGVVSSFDADGFTVGWTKSGSPTGTATINYLALR